MLDRDRVALTKLHNDTAEAIVQHRQGLSGDNGGNSAVVRFGHSASDTGQRIGISPKRHGLSHRILIV